MNVALETLRPNSGPLVLDGDSFPQLHWWARRICGKTVFELIAFRSAGF